MLNNIDVIPVLVVDDDSDDLDLMTALLTAGRGEYEVFTASSAGQALELLDTTEIDVCLVDLRLGESDGLDLVEQIKQAGFSCAFLLIAGFGSDDIDDRAVSLGVTQYLQKSEISVEALDRAVRYARPVPGPANVDKLASRKGNLPLQMALARDIGIREAAQAAGISERTAHRRIREEGFMDEVDRLRAELQGRILDLAAKDVLDHDRMK